MLASCSLDTDYAQDVETDDAFTGVQDVKNGMIGAYSALGNYPFLGNYAIAYNDICGGLSQGSSSSGHFYYQTYFSITPEDSEMEYIWSYGLKVADAAVRTINGADKVLATTANLSSDDIAEINEYKAQCYALRALANFTLVNFFAYPYAAGRDNLGLPLAKKQPLEVFASIDRSTVGETYDFILEDIDSAKVCYGRSGLDEGEFYINQGALSALEARVNLYMGNYAVAEEAAKAAIEWKGKGDATYTDPTPTDETYVNMWASVAITDEDIFTIAKSESDNLSANALNTLYGSYYAKVTSTLKGKFSDADIRANLIGEVDGNGNSIMKWQGISSSQATSNIPIFRKSEMALIVAECEARIGSIDEAKKYLGYTAKRDASLVDEATGLIDLTKLPSTQAELIDFIFDEGAREFFGEGHYLFEARRLGKKITVANGYAPDWDAAKFVFPIPSAEINAGFMKQQNDDWAAGLPE